MACWTTLPTSHRWTSTTWLLQRWQTYPRARWRRRSSWCRRKRSQTEDLLRASHSDTQKKKGGKATQETWSILPEKLRKNISCCTLSKRQNNCHLNCAMHFLHSHCQDRMRRGKKKQMVLWDLQIIQPKQLKIQRSICKSNSAKKQSRGLPGKGKD